MKEKRKSRKINKLRGQRSAGYGYTKGHRASGQRGGKGNAGSKKHHYIKVVQEDPRYFGKWGFKRPQKLQDNKRAVNIGDIDKAADRLTEAGKATKKGKKYTIDVTSLDIDKILGSGKVTKPLDLVGVKECSSRAQEKIVAKGGSIDIAAE
ncbi:MAG: 50S ribosomal protein L15 [Candidatus Thorarchaeota archaeon]|nr:50S ribosomal protein L15 [Candidatus Thorarchaeota archaeon]